MKLTFFLILASLSTFCFINCSAPTTPNVSSDLKDTSVSFEFNFSPDDNLSPGDSVIFNVHTNPKSEVTFISALRFVSPKSSPLSVNDLSSNSTIINGEAKLTSVIPEVVCKRKCSYQLIVLGVIANQFERVLMDTLISIDIIPTTESNKNDYFPLNEKNLYVFERRSDAWRFAYENIVDSLTISIGFLEKSTINGLDIYDFKVVMDRSNQKDQFYSVLKAPFSNRPEGFVELGNIYGFDASNYDSSSYYIDFKNVLFQFEAKKNFYHFFEDQERDIEYSGAGSETFSNKVYRSKYFKAGQLFIGGEYTFIEGIGLSRIKIAHDYTEIYTLKGAVIDGIVYGDTAKVLN